MSEEGIQSSVSVATPGGPAADSEVLVDQLMRRVQTLEEDKRRWKWIGIGAIALLLLVFCGGALLFVGGGAAYYRALQRDRDLEEVQRARMMAEIQMQEAQRAKLAAETAALEAQKKALEEAK